VAGLARFSTPWVARHTPTRRALQRRLIPIEIHIRERYGGQQPNHAPAHQRIMDEMHTLLPPTARRHRRRPAMECPLPPALHLHADLKPVETVEPVHAFAIDVAAFPSEQRGDLACEVFREYSETPLGTPYRADTDGALRSPRKIEGVTLLDGLYQRGRILHPLVDRNGADLGTIEREQYHVSDKTRCSCGVSCVWRMCRDVAEPLDRRARLSRFTWL
jgi:hypothetical protein